MALAVSVFDKAGSVRRVLRHGEQHVCGLCRNEYDDLVVAQACVVRCWNEFLRLEPVLKRSKGRSVSYRCRFCARDYMIFDEASACATACRTRLMEAFEVEALLTAEVGEIPEQPPKRTKPRLKMVRLQPPRVIKKKDPEAAEEGSEHSAEGSEASAAPAAEHSTEHADAPVAEQEQKAGEVQRDGDHKDDKKVEHV